MNSTEAQRSRRLRLGAALVALVAAVTVALGVGGLAHASDRGPEMGMPAATVGPQTPQTQEAEGKDPEANLPYLFAVFIITWAAFFGYVYLMSRRQREMRAEIDALRRVLTGREHQAVRAQPKQESAGGGAGPTSQ